MKKLLMPYKKGSFSLKNHLVMAPMTRSRAIGNLPNQLMADYYDQRSGAGLIITEGTAPVAEGLGYPRIPGIFSVEQTLGWRRIVDKIHRRNTKIFLQLMHTGRIGHKDNLPDGAAPVGPSDIKAAGQIFTDTKGLQEHSQPLALTKAAIAATIDGYVNAAKNAMAADFDGVEIHGANGYLPEQFLNPHVNNRRDEYGGSMENRARFVLEIISKIADTIGKDKVGVRFSPYSTMGDLTSYGQGEVHETYVYLARQLEAIGIAYIHISANPDIPEKTYQEIRGNFSGTIILCNGLTPETGEAALHAGFADVVAFGRSFIANPDFKERIEKDLALNPIDFNTFYTPGAAGYIDYPALK